MAKARDELSRFYEVKIDRGILDAAATLAPTPALRGLDAIPLSSAKLLAADLRAVLTCDQRMATVAAALGLPVAAPV